MKRFLFFIVVLAITNICFGQDVIVKKDGATIVSKVLEIGISEIKYKKYDNADGPTYVISTSDVMAINYANGKKEDFSAKPMSQTSVSVITEDTRSWQKKMRANDLYRQARTYKVWSWVAVVVGASGAVASLVCIEESTPKYIGLGAGVLLCTAVGGSLMGIGQRKKNEAEYITNVPFMKHDFKIGNTIVTPSLNILADNKTRHKTIGVGINLNL